MSGWLPLEANPEVLNAFLRNVGVSSWEFHDVFGLDDDLLGMVPQPVEAVLMVFPITEAYGENARIERERIERDGQALPPHFFIRQTIANACGTIGLLHSVASNPRAPIEPGSFVATFLAEQKDATPAERAAALERSNRIEQVHVAASQQGQTRPPEPEDDVNLHFICLTNVGGTLVEFDGCKAFPISHGPTSAETLLSDCARVVREFISRTPDNVNFNLVALSSAAAE
eukprot:GILI01014098.1.p1 GENE.GILI01014098.1~~GILI01014098.1.p1  ORF type:complete len:229 (-),score=36.97 GILI01014098.1:53-739(-)